MYTSKINICMERLMCKADEYQLVKLDQKKFKIISINSSFRGDIASKHTLFVLSMFREDQILPKTKKLIKAWLAQLNC